MGARLRDNWVYGGCLAAWLMLGLSPVLARDWPMVLLLVWLQLPVYMLHQYEEHDDDRFRRFVNAMIGQGMDVLTRSDVFVINIVGVWGFIAGAFSLAALVHPAWGLVAVYLSLVNGVGHGLQAAAMRRCNPGLLTSIVLFIPLGIVTLVVFAHDHEATPMHHAIALAVSLGIHLVIVVRVLTGRAWLASN
ncbi:HXXEE domain-containing protein [Novosphingobium sp.]|uniref:HXXEE domain-containing protein n=1 Tax=Novosphingobium sp. TaxID=1874826 RepID=UPI002FDCA316